MQQHTRVISCILRKGIEAWNEAFTLIERPAAVRAILPGDEASFFGFFVLLTTASSRERDVGL